MKRERKAIEWYVESNGIDLRSFRAGDEPSEYLRKRRLVSTIETSPSRSLLEHSTVTSVSGHGSYVGYCTIRNGMPLHEFSNLATKHKSVSSIWANCYPSTRPDAAPNVPFPNFPAIFENPIIHRLVHALGAIKSSPISQRGPVNLKERIPRF